MKVEYSECKRTGKPLTSIILNKEDVNKIIKEGYLAIDKHHIIIYEDLKDRAKEATIDLKKILGMDIDLVSIFSKMRDEKKKENHE